MLKTPELPDGLGGDGFIGKISTVYMYLIFFIHSSVYGRLDCFHVQGYTIISSPYFWVDSLPSLIKDQICSLELREDQTRSWGHERALQSPAQFLSPIFFDIPQS